MGNIAQIEGVSELPGELTQLQNGRWRLVRRVPLQSAGNVGDKTFEPLGAALATIYETKEDEAKFKDLVLISANSGSDIVNRAQSYVLTKVYETLTGEFVGELDDVTDYEMNGLKRVRRTLIAKAGTSVAGFAVGAQSYGSGPTLYLAAVKVEENDAYVRVLAEYLEPGVVSRGSRLIDGGLKEVTVRSFYAQNAASPGIVVSQTEENENGYPVWASTTLQKADGTSPTSAGAALTHGAEVTFTYPGVANFYSVSITAGYAGLNYWLGDVDLSPPIDAIVEATVAVSYSATSTFPTVTPARWNPMSWAKLTSYWVTSGVEPTSKSQGLRGYRVGATNTLSYPGGFDKASFFGQFVYGSSSAILSGGPEDPSGNSYTLSYKVEPAFVDVDGTQYYRRTQVTATIP